MQKWPVEPQTAPVVLLRTWLNEKMYNKDASVATPAAMIATVTTYAERMGMPADEGANKLLSLYSNGGGKKLNQNGQQGGGAGNSDKPKGRPREGQNDCEGCDSDLCKAKKESSKCIVKQLADGKFNADNGIPNYPKSGNLAVTSSELWHLKA